MSGAKSVSRASLHRFAPLNAAIWIGPSSLARAHSTDQAWLEQLGAKHVRHGMVRSQKQNDSRERVMRMLYSGGPSQDARSGQHGGGHALGLTA